MDSQDNSPKKSAEHGQEEDSDCTIIQEDHSIINVDESVLESNDSSVPILDSINNECTTNNDIIILDDTLDINNSNHSEEVIINEKTDLKNNNISVSEETPSTLLDIKFGDKKTYLKFQFEFLTLIKRKFKNKLDDIDIFDDIIEKSIRVCEKKLKKDDKYLIDTTPNSKIRSNSEATPSYRKSFSDLILSNENTETVEPKRALSKRCICFNCGNSNHQLRDCPLAKNMTNINKARKEFNSMNRRYHKDIENEYGHFVPGQISDELKNALSLGENDIPLHVYRMRLFGYPPGWLEEAKIQHSGLSLIVDNGQVLMDEDVDEGEIDDKTKFNLQKIYDFPGFNVYPDHIYHDKCDFFGVPPLLPQQAKSEMIRLLGDSVINGYKKKKLSDYMQSEYAAMENVNNAIEMEIENEDDNDIVTFNVNTDNNETNVPSSPIADQKNVIANEVPLETTIPLDDLIEERRKLMEEINNIQSSTPDAASLNITNCSMISSIDNTILDNSVNENRENSSKSHDSNDVHQDSEITEETIETGHVVDTLYGAPVLNSFTPYEKLPSNEKFQVGVCDVIAFENLAESTGKYEQMKNIIDKVRGTMKQLQHDQ